MAAYLITTVQILTSKLFYYLPIISSKHLQRTQAFPFHTHIQLFF